MTQNQPEKSPSPTRPFALDPLFTGLQTLSGVGTKLLPLLTKLVGGGRILDVLFHRPIDVIDRTYRPDLHHAAEGKIATLDIDIIEHRPNKRSNLPYRIIGGDGVGYVDLVFFNVRGDYLEKQYPPGGKVCVSGKLERFAGKWQMAHPDLMTLEMAARPFEPVYPLTAGITNKMVQKFVGSALPRVPELPEWLAPELIRREKWGPFKDSLTRLHHLESPEGLGAQTPHRRRLAYDELLADQLTIAILRAREKTPRGRMFKIPQDLRERLLSSLPFTLTPAQTRAIAEIDADMTAPLRMMRLLQGDVGSGKTIVAALAMLNAAGCGVQAAIMAPTEILAQQHAKTLLPLFDSIGITGVVLTGRHKGAARTEILSNIANGSVRIIIGTHALFQEGVTFHDLGLVVIDEQHRFGVHQRLTLTQKGVVPDMLVMTATPIPRTLALTAYGDLDVSKLDEKPPGRRPVDTRLIPASRYEELATKIGAQAAAGVQVYWVCPLVEESEILDLAAAEDRFQDLSNRFSDIRIGLIHGRMKPAEKDSVMTAFARGDIRILVATTVIEVGVNVPNASIMVIEESQRYGLSQLHQLRGRVGRGGAQSFCFLLHASECGETARARLKIMRDSEDGFYIAEQDLILRGAGDILGTQQSGIQIGRLADLGAHGDLLDMARDDAAVILNKDPGLTSPRGAALRHLLYLFERDRAITLLKAG